MKIQFLRSFRRAALGASLSVMALVTGVGRAESISSFGLLVLPDTQFYSRYSIAGANQFLPRYGSEPYATQTSWIAQHAASLGVPFVLHLGDVVDRPGTNGEWVVADAAMETLETAGVPYSILAGNHDVMDQGITDTERNLAAEPYLTWFPASRAAAQPTFRGRDATGFHEYHIFQDQGRQFLVLALSWRISSAGLQWARDVMDAHPSLPVIITTHDALKINSDGVTAEDTTYGNMLWDELIENRDQVFMIMNGHNHGSAWKLRQNSFGRDVLQVVVDYQMAFQGGNGYMRLFEFDFTNNEIRALTFSPWVIVKPANTLTQFDRAVLAESNNEYTIPFDFAQRFAAFAPGFGAGVPNRNEPLTETVRNMILDGYNEPETPEVSRPYDREDYPRHPQTLAHWRFDGGVDGQPVADGAIVPDLAGANSLRRNPLNGSVQIGDLVWSDDKHALSAAAGSVRFVTPNPVNNFLTDVAASLNNDTLTTGYTIEAIVKIDPAWTAAANQWMSIMTRGGKRSSVPGWSGGWGDSSTMQFAVSNLREVQWEITTMPTPTTLQSKTNWSGEIMVDQWQHIALVNDPVTHDTTMYVAGAPVLRNVTNAIGIATSPNQPWVVGGAVNGASGGGFFGNVSEVRITRAALEPDQWLTTRKNRVRGTGGRQSIAGTASGDQIFGNAAADTISGGDGADTFVYRSLRDGLDTITDFTPGEDKLNVVELLASIGHAGGDPLADGTLRAIPSGAGALVQVRVSGSYRNLILLNGLTAGQAAAPSNFLF